MVRVRKKFNQWMPDQAFWSEDVVSDAKNVLPDVDGFRPLKSYVATSGALVERCRGAATFRKRDNVRTLIAGDRESLYKYNQGSTNFDDISDATYTTEGGTGFWDFCQFGDLAIMTNLADPVKKYDIVAAPATVSNLGGAPPQARFCKVVGPHVVLAHLDGEEDSVHWSSVNSAEGWTIGTNLSDKQQLREGGRIMGLLGDIGDVGYLFQERSIKSMMKVPGSPLIFQIEIADPDRGSAAFRGMRQIGSAAFYLAHDGFMLFQNGQSTPIATERVERWFYDNALNAQISRVVCGIDPRQKLVMWSFISTEYGQSDIDAGFGDKILLYNWVLKRWARADLEVSAFVDVVNTPYTLDTIDSFGDLDSLPFSLDSPFWNGDNIATQLGVFGTDFKLGNLTGANMEALIEMKNVHLFPPGRQYVRGAWPVCDSPDVQIAIAGIEDLDTAPSYGSYVGKETTGYIPLDSSSRLHSLRMKIPSSTWSHAEGMFLDCDMDGDA